MYTDARILLIRALTPLHVGTGRAEKFYVDLPIQRDEFGFPALWASSLKGAIKANIDSALKEYLGSEPHRVPTKPSAVSFLDARLFLIPVRILSNVWSYATTPTLLELLNNYLESLEKIKGVSTRIDISSYLDKLSRGIAVVSRDDIVRNGKIMVNEIDLVSDVQTGIIDKSGIGRVLPNEVKSRVLSRGLVLLPDRDNIGLSIINRSMFIQYRIRLSRDSKTVEEGPWSEEYVPIETLFMSLMLCRDVRENQTTKDAETLCNEISKSLSGRAMYVGGKETIGRGLIKVYVIDIKQRGV